MPTVFGSSFAMVKILAQTRVKVERCTLGSPVNEVAKGFNHPLTNFVISLFDLSKLYVL